MGILDESCTFISLSIFYLQAQKKGFDGGSEYLIYPSLLIYGYE